MARGGDEGAAGDCTPQAGARAGPPALGAAAGLLFEQYTRRSPAGPLPYASGPPLHAGGRHGVAAVACAQNALLGSGDDVPGEATVPQHVGDGRPAANVTDAADSASSRGVSGAYEASTAGSSAPAAAHAWQIRLAWLAQLLHAGGASRGGARHRARSHVLVGVLRAAVFAALAATALSSWSLTYSGSPGASGAFAVNSNWVYNTFTISLTVGQTLAAGTCYNGGTCTGDTVLMLWGPDGSTVVASNDDYCGKCSYYSYVATTAGVYTVLGACASTSTCSATVVITRADLPPPPPLPPLPPLPPSPNPPPRPSPPPWLGPLCSFGEAHRFSPNAAGNIANGTLVSSSLVIDQPGDGVTAWTMSAGAGATYDGTSLSFDGTTDAYVSFGSVTFGSSPFTLSVWGKYRAVNAGGSRILDFSASANSIGGVLVTVAGTNNLQLTIYVGGVGGLQTQNVVLNQWFHLAIAITPPSTVVYYWNGAGPTPLAGSGTVSIGSATYSYVAGFGKSGYSGNTFLVGNIGEFRLFPRAITQPEASALYSGVACPPPPSPPSPPPSPPPNPPPSFPLFNFTASGTFVVPPGVVRVAVLVVGGGGGGGWSSAGGNGGAVVYNASVPVTPGASVAVVVGAGGAGDPEYAGVDGRAGGASSFGAIVAAGGAVSSGMGYRGGDGAGGAGSAGVEARGGAGGPGVSYALFGAAYYGGGGGGGTYNGIGGSGGQGGGGTGAGSCTASTAGVSGTGGGGGGQGYNYCTVGSAGGSGVVLVMVF